MGVDEYVESVLKGSPWYVTITNKPVIRNIMGLRVVKMLIRKFLMKPLAFASRDSTMYWVQNNMQDRISAFFKDKQSWQAIPSQLGRHQAPELPGLPAPGPRLDGIIGR